MTKTSVSAIVSRRVDGLKLHAGPRRASEVLDKLAPGDRVEIKKMVGNWAWVKVSKSSQTGYLYEPYLDPAPVVVLPPPPPDPLTKLARLSARMRRERLILLGAAAVSIVVLVLTLLLSRGW